MTAINNCSLFISYLKIYCNIIGSPLDVIYLLYTVVYSLIPIKNNAYRPNRKSLTSFFKFEKISEIFPVLVASIEFNIELCKLKRRFVYRLLNLHNKEKVVKEE